MCAADSLYPFHYSAQTMSSILIALHTARKMPKAITANSYPRFVTVAKDDVSGIATTTTLNVNKTKFAKLSVSRKQKKSYTKPIPLRTRLDPEYATECSIELEEHLDRIKELSSLIKQYRLIERIEERSTTPPPSDLLIDRIGPPIYDAPKPLPQGIRFQKAKIILRKKEYWPMILATGDRLMRFQDKYDQIGLKEIYQKDVDNLIGVFNRFRNTFEDRAHRFTNKEWRLIKRDVNMVKRIDFGKTGNWDVACSELAALNKQECFDY